MAKKTTRVTRKIITSAMRSRRIMYAVISHLRCYLGTSSYKPDPETTPAFEDSLEACQISPHK
jgi:hypothetical protein